MTDHLTGEQLAEIETAASDPRDLTTRHDVLKLVAEVRRLRAVVDAARAYRNEVYGTEDGASTPDSELALDGLFSALDQLDVSADMGDYEGWPVFHGYVDPAAPTSEPVCDGRCATAADLGMAEYGDMIATPDPECSLHGLPAAPTSEETETDG